MGILFDKVINLSASYDKETKTTWRYNIDSNDQNISGCLYISKKDGVKTKNLPDTLKIKIKEPEED